MAKETSDQAVFKATGKTKKEWYDLINAHMHGDSSHKEIAAYVYNTFDISFWWAQEITVMWEKVSGRRVVGQTKGSGFQVGVNKTFPLALSVLWDKLVSGPGVAYILGEDFGKTHGQQLQADSAGITGGGITYQVTTFVPYSHLRMRWQFPGWDRYSILQVRVTKKSEEKTILTFHQEKLQDAAAREKMKEYWKTRIAKIAGL
jgi:hypothetical protein